MSDEFDNDFDFDYDPTEDDVNPEDIQEDLSFADMLAEALSSAEESVGRFTEGLNDLKDFLKIQLEIDEERINSLIERGYFRQVCDMVGAGELNLACGLLRSIGYEIGAAFEVEDLVTTSYHHLMELSNDQQLTVGQSQALIDLKEISDKYDLNLEGDQNNG